MICEHDYASTTSLYLPPHSSNPHVSRGRGKVVLWNGHWEKCKNRYIKVVNININKKGLYLLLIFH